MDHQRWFCPPQTLIHQLWNKTLSLQCACSNSSFYHHTLTDSNYNSTYSHLIYLTSSGVRDSRPLGDIAVSYKAHAYKAYKAPCIPRHFPTSYKPTCGCHYFLPGPWLLFQQHAITTAWSAGNDTVSCQKHIRVSNLHRVTAVGSLLRLQHQLQPHSHSWYCVRDYLYTCLVSTQEITGSGRASSIIQKKFGIRVDEDECSRYKPRPSHTGHIVRKRCDQSRRTHCRPYSSRKMCNSNCFAHINQRITPHSRHSTWLMSAFVMTFFKSDVISISQFQPCRAGVWFIYYTAGAWLRKNGIIQGRVFSPGRWAADRVVRKRLPSILSIFNRC